MDREELKEKVIALVAETLDRDAAIVTPDASLIDDLGAESIDFLDIVFRLESAFEITIKDDEIWKGETGVLGDSPEAIEQGVALLRERRPGFRWDRLPARVTRQDLPRLITVQTILDYLEPRLGAGAAEAVNIA